MNTPSNAARRRIIVAAAGTALAASARAADEVGWKPSDPELAAIGACVPLVLPRTEFVYEALFELAPTLQLGASPFGERASCRSPAADSKGATSSSEWRATSERARPACSRGA